MEEFKIREAAKLVNLKPHTLRYYESIGLIKDIKRNSAGERIYVESDLKSLAFINRLRSTGMKISKMIEYAKLRNIGDETITDRKNILLEHLNHIESEIDQLNKTKKYVSEKIKLYNEAEEKINGTTK